jgi:antitoxin FitA
MQLDETTMATLTIRNVDAAVKERLRVRAAQRGRSMEAELRAIVSEASRSMSAPSRTWPRQSGDALHRSAGSISNRIRR